MLNHHYIGTEHILLGLIHEGEGVAAQVLVKLGAELTRVRQQVIQLLSGYQGKRRAEGVPSNIVSPPELLADFKNAIKLDEARRIRDIVSQSHALIAVLNAHNVESSPELIIQLIEWKKGV